MRKNSRSPRIQDYPQINKNITPMRSKRAKKTKILVVEDETIVARDIRNMLKGLGYEVVAIVPSGKESIKKAKEKKPDLVLMDIMLQGEFDGVKAADEIYNTLNIPVVYLTAYANETTLQRAKITEPFGYILKPFEERELHTTIEVALYKYKMEMKLKEREQWLSTILRSIADAVIATDKEGTITYMNPLAESLTGWKQEKTTKMPLSNVFKIISEDERRPLKISVKNIIQKGDSGPPSDVILLSKNGKETSVDHRAGPIKNEKGNISGTVLVFTDITRRKITEEELSLSWEKLKGTIEKTLQAMAFTIETRDPYTAGHQRRVTKLACAIAKEMNLPEVRIEGLRMAGELHDIGKIYVPAEILSKPGKISEAEYNIIKTHPQVGFDILKTIEFPWPIAKIIFQHHERMDGSGYPSCIREKKILMEARILAVADVIEAMATHRPYRPAQSIEKALKEISTNRGILYDAKVVDACLKVFEKGFKFD